MTPDKIKLGSIVLWDCAASDTGVVLDVNPGLGTGMTHYSIYWFADKFIGYHVTGEYIKVLVP